MQGRKHMQPRYPRTPLCPWSPGGSDRGNLQIDMREFAGTTICVTEKLDGSNVAIRQAQAWPRSGNPNSPAPWLAMCRKHIAWRTMAHPSLTLYGEDIYGVHTIRYDPVPEDRTFRLFGVLEDVGWASWDRVEEVARLLAIDTVPVLFRGRYASVNQLRDGLLKLMDGPSELVLSQCWKGRGRNDGV